MSRKQTIQLKYEIGLPSSQPCKPWNKPRKVQERLVSRAADQLRHKARGATKVGSRWSTSRLS